MSDYGIKGKNFMLDNGTINFFGAKGALFGNGNWGLNGLGGDLLMEIKPSTVLPKIQGCIDMDVDCGDGDEIAQVQLGPRQAVTLFLEGGLTKKNLLDAIEGDGYIDFPNVELCGWVLTVRILEDTEIAVATADKDGEIL